MRVFKLLLLMSYLYVFVSCNAETSETNNKRLINLEGNIESKKSELLNEETSLHSATKEIRYINKELDSGEAVIVVPAGSFGKEVEIELKMQNPNAFSEVLGETRILLDKTELGTAWSLEKTSYELSTLPVVDSKNAVSFYLPIKINSFDLAAWDENLPYLLVEVLNNKNRNKIVIHDSSKLELAGSKIVFRTKNLQSTIFILKSDDNTQLFKRTENKEIDINDEVQNASSQEIPEGETNEFLRDQVEDELLEFEAESSEKLNNEIHAETEVMGNPQIIKESKSVADLLENELVESKFEAEKLTSLADESVKLAQKIEDTSTGEKENSQNNTEEIFYNAKEEILLEAVSVPGNTGKVKVINAWQDITVPLTLELEEDAEEAEATKAVVEYSTSSCVYEKNDNEAKDLILVNCSDGSTAGDTIFSSSLELTVVGENQAKVSISTDKLFSLENESEANLEEENSDELDITPANSIAGIMDKEQILRENKYSVMRRYGKFLHYKMSLLLEELTNEISSFKLNKLSKKNLKKKTKQIVKLVDRHIKRSKNRFNKKIRKLHLRIEKLEDKISSKKQKLNFLMQKYHYISQKVEQEISYYENYLILIDDLLAKVGVVSDKMNYLGKTPLQLSKQVKDIELLLKGESTDLVARKSLLQTQAKSRLIKIQEKISKISVTKSKEKPEKTRKN